MRNFAKTDVGRVRVTNQDAYRTEILAGGAVLAIVCDGMGGANAGNVASQMAVDLIFEYCKSSYRSEMDADSAARMLSSAMRSANIALYDAAVKDAALSGMGTTAVAAIIKGKQCAVVHVGDSRAYLVNGNITQLTRDHSVVQSLIESGKLTPEEARFHPRKNVITRALGAEEEVLPDCSVFSVDTGDTLLLCTDGLTNFVDTEEILDIFRNNDISRAADVLVARANHNGGGDNITAVTVTL